VPAVWLPYGSTSISIKIDHEDLAWVLPRNISIDLPNIQELNSFLKSFPVRRKLFLIDPSLPSGVKDFLTRNNVSGLRELVYFDMLFKEPEETMPVESACLLSYPYFDPVIGFRGLGENLIPFYPTLWKDFKSNVFEAFRSGRKVDLKSYLKDLCNNIDLELVVLAPWVEGSKILLKNNPLEAYEAIESFKKGLTENIDSRVEILIVSAGGDPFDESFSRALTIFSSSFRDYSCNRLILVAEGSIGLGLDPELLLGNNSESEMPIIMKYIDFCKSLIKNSNVYVVSAIPESLLKIMIDAKAYDTLLEAYKASRLFLPKGSKTGVITHAPFYFSENEWGYRCAGSITVLNKRCFL